MPKHNIKAFLDGAQIAQAIFTLRPDYRELLMAVENIVAGASNDTSEQMLRDAEEAVRTTLAKQGVTTIPHIAAWREAYTAFGTKPNKNRNSLEALTRRAEKGVPRVNRLTDIYNAISVKHQIPLGGEDLDKYTDSPRLIRASSAEQFLTTASGETITEHPGNGEVVWCDGDYITCHHWNWRQSFRTALDDNTTGALFIFDAIEPVSDESLQAAGDELRGSLLELGPEVEVEQRIIGKDS